MNIFFGNSSKKWILVWNIHHSHFFSILYFVISCVALCCVMLCHVVCSANLGQYSSFIVLFYYVWLCNDNKEFSCHLSYIFSSTLLLCLSQVAERERAEEIITSEGEWKQKYNSVLSHIVLVINQAVHCHLSFVYMSINCYVFFFLSDTAICHYCVVISIYKPLLEYKQRYQRDI